MLRQQYWLLSAIWMITPEIHQEFYTLLTSMSYNNYPIGDDRLRRERLVPDCEPRGTELEKSVQTLSANRTDYAALPLAA
jgi:hypothetical protein